MFLMTTAKTKATTSFMSSSISVIASISAALFLSACASPQKVDRVHASMYHQQASIQQLQTDMERVEKQRQQLTAELERLEQDGSSSQRQIDETRTRLEALETKQSDIALVMRQLNGNVASNTRSITTLRTNEEKRREIIRAQQLRWQKITAQTNARLAEIESTSSVPATGELNRGESSDVQTR